MDDYFVASRFGPFTPPDEFRDGETEKELETETKKEEDLLESDLGLDEIIYNAENFVLLFILIVIIWYIV